MKSALTALFLASLAPAAPPALQRWDLDTPVARFALPAPLREVSGLAVTADGRLFAHDDERAVIHEVDLGKRTATKSFRLGVKGDLEGLAITPDGRFFLVTSDGDLFETREGKDGESVPFTVTRTGLGKACEIEGLGFEPPEVLLIGCKSPVKKALTIFRFSLGARRLASPDSVRVPLGKHHPSSVERDPSTGHLLVACAREHVLLEVTPSGELVATRPLDRRRHPQAEGIAVLPDGRLVVSDEGKDAPGTLTVYGAR